MCGVIGVYGSKQASYETYQGLFTLQHRGQDASGIISTSPHSSFLSTKGIGTINETFNKNNIKSLQGNMAIGHTRYSTVGGHQEKNIQPFFTNSPLTLGVVHNGNIVNYHQLANEIEENGITLTTSNDSEVIHQVINQALQKTDDFFKALEYVYERLVGGYAVLGIIPNQGFFAFRDPNGIRPLVYGMKEVDGAKQYIFSSETFALDFLNYQLIRDIGPGEAIFIDLNGNITNKSIRKNKLSPCMLEWVYFSGPEGTLEEKSIYNTRTKLGHELAGHVSKLIESGKINPHLVAPVPDSGRIAADSLADQLNIPYKEILIKNRYVQRSFILKSQNERLETLNLKFRPILDEVKGKNILLVDDSLVRGNTLKTLIKLLRKYQAAEIYCALTCPPIGHPCYYGIDFPDPKELLATGKTIEEMEAFLEIDKLIYQDLEGLQRAIQLPGLCQACLNGDYPTSTKEAQIFIKERVLSRQNME